MLWRKPVWGTMALVFWGGALDAQATRTFAMPDSVLLFGTYDQLHVVTPDGEQVLRPPVDLKYNGGYFAIPSLAPRGDVIAWGFATEATFNQTTKRLRFTLGLYRVADQKWQTYGDFAFIGDTAFSADGRQVAFIVDGTDGIRSRLLIFDAAAGTFREGPYQRGMQSHAGLSWSPDGTRLATQIDRPGESSVVAVLDLATGTAHELGLGYQPRWSPNGEWIAYYSERRCVLVHADGNGTKTVLALKDGWFTSRRFAGRSPVWSPDSTQLLVNVVKNDERVVDVVLLDVASGRTTTKVRNGLSVFGWARPRP